MTDDINDELNIKQSRKELQKNAFTPDKIDKEFTIERGEVAQFTTGSYSIYIESLGDSFRIYFKKGNIREGVIV